MRTIHGKSKDGRMAGQTAQYLKRLNIIFVKDNQIVLMESNKMQPVFCINKY